MVAGPASQRSRPCGRRLATTETLASSSQELGRKLYEASAAQSQDAPGGGDGAGASAASDDDIVDAEIVDDEQK